MSDLLLVAYVSVRCAATTTLDRLRRCERGEGVISAAIAVLVMAFFGAALWVAFKEFFDSTAKKTTTQMEKIGD